MPWVRAHPYATALIAAFVLIVVGIYIVAQRNAVTTGGQTLAWGGLNGFLNTAPDTQAAPRNIPRSDQEVNTPAREQARFYYNPQQAQGQGQADQTDNSDLEKFLASLSHPAGTEVSNGAGGAIDPYSFIPQGFISTTTSYESRSPAVQSLFEYGNEVGSNIQNFENTHPNMARVLKDQFEDRQNPQKIGALVELARSLSGVGNAMLIIDPIPASVAALNNKLAASYREMGAKLEKIPEAKTDEEMYNAIITYDAAADAFIKNYVSLATLLSVS